MTASDPKWVVEDKHRLLAAVAQKLAGNAHVSLEGDLSVFNLAILPGASDSETDALKRNTIWPKQDFLVFPLELHTFEEIFRRLSYRVPGRIIHIQIERGGILEFGAYDRFHRDCIFWGPTLTDAFIQSLAAQGILSPSKHRTK